jgi:hypothetical protein
MTKSETGRQTEPSEKPAKSRANATKATSGTLPEMTADEKTVFDRAVAQRGQAWAEQHVNLILDQAREIGNL